MRLQEWKLVCAFFGGVLMVGVASAQEVKDPRPASDTDIGQYRGALAGFFGPDDFGYSGADETTTQCQFDWIDISATGTFVVDGDDTASGSINLGGSGFHYYGDQYTELNMSANGYITTDLADTGPDLSNDCPLPVTPSTGGGARIYPLHDDLVLSPGTGRGLYQYFASCPRPGGWGADEGCHVFQWDQANHFGGGELFDLQAVLYETSGSLVFQHGPGNPELGSGSTTGIQNADATIGLTYACDAADSIQPESAQCIYHPDFAFGAGSAAEPQAVPTRAIWSVLVLTLLVLLVGVRRYGRRAV